MNNEELEILKEFDKKIEILDNKVNKIDKKIQKLIDKTPKWYNNYASSIIVALVVSLIIVPTYLELIESRQMDNVYFLLITDENTVITNEKINALYNFSILNYNTEIIKNDVTLEMSFNFEDENISVTEINTNYPYKEHTITDNTIKYVWDYIPEKVDDSAGRIFLVFRVIRFLNTGGTLTIRDASEIAPIISVTMEDYGMRNVITPTGFLWER